MSKYQLRLGSGFYHIYVYMYTKWYIMKWFKNDKTKVKSSFYNV